MVARSDHADGFGVRPAVVLRASEKIERAHRHGEVGLFGEAADQAVQDGIFHVGIDFNPAGRGEDALHGGFRTENQEIDHVAGIAVFVGNAAGNFGEEVIVDAGKRGHVLATVRTHGQR